MKKVKKIYALTTTHPYTPCKTGLKLARYYLPKGVCIRNIVGNIVGETAAI